MLNQAHAGTLFLKIDPVQIVSMCVFVCVFVCVRVCVCARMRVCVCPLGYLITSGVMWHDMDPYDWLNKFYSCYMATVVVIVNGRGLGIGTRRRH